MATVSVPALKPFDREGRSYVRGELVDLEPIEAATRARRGEVSLTRGVVITREMDAEPEAQPVVRTRRQYRRRDMTAEGAAE